MNLWPKRTCGYTARIYVKKESQCPSRWSRGLKTRAVIPKRACCIFLLSGIVDIRDDIP